jgi:outer membrane immunogenic protein
MKKILVAGIAAAAFCGAPAFAADMPTKGPVYRPVDPMFNWTGFYAGGNVGYGWGKSDVTNVSTNDIAFFPAGGGESIHPKGWVGGGQLGYNWQTGQLVTGLEASYSASGMKKVLSNVSYLDPTATLIATSKIRDITSATAKIGIANNRWLAYVDAGYARANVPLNLHRTAGGAALEVFASTSQWYNGWTVGAGVDYAIAQNVSLGISYNYYDFGTQTQTTTRLPLSAGGATTSNRVSATANVALVKLNYLFGAR